MKHEYNSLEFVDYFLSQKSSVETLSKTINNNVETETSFYIV